MLIPLPDGDLGMLKQATESLVKNRWRAFNNSGVFSSKFEFFVYSPYRFGTLLFGHNK